MDPPPPLRFPGFKKKVQNKDGMLTGGTKKLKSFLKSEFCCPEYTIFNQLVWLLPMGKNVSSASASVCG
jgi:hypothetical protein